MAVSTVCQVRSFFAVALAVGTLTAVRHFQVASGEMEGWNDWSSHASWQAYDIRLPWSSSNGYFQQQHFGKYAVLRDTLDYTYHSRYSKSRQILQDGIIDSILNSTIIMDPDGHVCDTPATQPWIVFTAGAMGAGKSWTIRQLFHNQRFPLKSFVRVDPDDIRHFLPEFQEYLKTRPLQAGEWTRKEAGYVAELLTLAALQQGKNVLVDGSLRDAAWYKLYFDQLRSTYDPLRIAILHISAPSETVLQRAKERSLETGRVVPQETLEQALEQVPRSVSILKDRVDYFAEIHNANELTLVTPGTTWDSFSSVWTQQCRSS